MSNLKLNRVETNKWLHNIQVFLAPVGVLYITSIIGVISQEGHTFVLADLIPNTFTQGGIVLFFLNALLDYLRKLRG